MAKLAVDALLSFSFFPLRIASYLGIITALGAAILIFYTLFVTAQGTTVKGWPSTIVIMLFLGSIQLIAIGIIGEYLGRIYEEVKRRPLYIIDKSFGIESRAETKT
jgi:dolichol-phosphate mannosyltransferase